jgi:hypothetical protein
LQGCRHKVEYQPSEEAAINRLLSSQHVVSLNEQVEGRRLVTRVEGAEGQTYFLYLGDWGPDFDTRIGQYKVKPDGSLWLMDPGDFEQSEWQRID